MRDLNRVQLIGRLGQDPELRYTPNGHAVVSWNLAVNMGKKQGSDWIDATEWVRCVAWRQLAEQIATLSKGTTVYIEGKLSTREYDDKDGVTHHVTEVIVSTAAQLLWPRAGQAGDSKAGPWPESETGPTRGDDMAAEADDLPF